MVIRNYHWLNSASRVLISTCSAPLVQTRDRKQTHYNPRLTKVKVDPHARYQSQKVKWFKQESTHRLMDGHTHTHATKRIISPATRSIISCIGIWQLFVFKLASNFAVQVGPQLDQVEQAAGCHCCHLTKHWRERHWYRNQTDKLEPAPDS